MTEQMVIRKYFLDIFERKFPPIFGFGTFSILKYNHYSLVFFLTVFGSSFQPNARIPCVSHLLSESKSSGHLFILLVVIVREEIALEMILIHIVLLCFTKMDVNNKSKRRLHIKSLDIFRSAQCIW